MKLKVCGMRDPDNIAAIARLNPDFMGLIFYAPSPRYAGGLAPEALDILSPVTKRVGVFVDADEQTVRETATKYRLNYVQLHGGESPEMCASLRRDYGVIKAFGVATAADLAATQAYEGMCDLYVFDTKTPLHGGSGRRFDHSILAAYTGRTPYLLSGGITPDDADEFAASRRDTPGDTGAIVASRRLASQVAQFDSRCVGFDINSRFETAPGVKDSRLVKQFIETFKNDNKMNRIDKLFTEKKQGIFSVYFTAGYPNLGDTVPVLTELAAAGVDMIEVGIPFSDPMADGPVIQQSSTVALRNGMNLKTLFGQLAGVRETVDVPLVMMGYLNPIMQYGVEAFCRNCAEVGVDGMIIPDLPFADYLRDFKPVLDKYGLHCIMLITPETSDERIRLIDEHTSGFIYMVSTASTTGARDSFDPYTMAYFERVDAMSLRNPRMIGFGISNRATFAAATQHAAGAIVGSAFVRLLGQCESVSAAVTGLVEKLR